MAEHAKTGIILGYLTDPNDESCLPVSGGPGDGRERNIDAIASDDLRQIFEDSCSMNGNGFSLSVAHFGVHIFDENPWLFIDVRSQYLSRKSGISIKARNRWSRTRALEL